MGLQSFLNKELKQIDLKVSRGEYFFPLLTFPLISLLGYVATTEIYFFESKDFNFSFLGLGKSFEIRPEDAQTYLEKNPDHYLVYQALFEEHSKKTIFLPEWVFIQKDGKTTLQIYKSLESQSYSPANLLFNQEAWESKISPWSSYEERPRSDEWGEMIDQSLNLFSNNELEKLVLSRKKIFHYDHSLECAAIFQELYHQNKDGPHYSLFYQFDYERAFISFSPEKLFTVVENELQTVSLAGSTLRGENKSEDDSFERTLTHSKKLIHEHDLVTHSIMERLTSFSVQVEVSPLVTMKLPYIQHRQSNITAKLKEGISILSLINLLHPTPAVGGMPVEKSKQFIFLIEKEKRDYYAAPLGIISKNFSEIIVAIRSAYIDKQKIIVYGGAGIVSGSLAEEEWIETNAKMQPFIKVLNKSLEQE